MSEILCEFQSSFNKLRKKRLALHTLWLLNNETSRDDVSNDEILSAMKFELFTVLDLMLEKLMNIDDLNKLALQSGKVSVYKWLRSRDPNFELTEELFIIACCGHTDLLRLLLEKENVPKLKNSDNAYLNAVESESIKCLQLLLDYNIGTPKRSIMKKNQNTITTPNGKTLVRSIQNVSFHSMYVKNMKMFLWLEKNIGNIDYKGCYDEALRYNFVDFVKYCNKKGLVELIQNNFLRLMQTSEGFNYYMEHGPPVPKDFYFGDWLDSSTSYEALVRIIEHGFTSPLDNPQYVLLTNGDDNNSLRKIKYLNSKGCKKTVDCLDIAIKSQQYNTMIWLMNNDYPYNSNIIKDVCFGSARRVIKCLKYLIALDENKKYYMRLAWTCYRNAMNYMNYMNSHKEYNLNLLRFLYENGCPLDERCFECLPNRNKYKNNVKNFLINVKCPGWEKYV